MPVDGEMFTLLSRSGRRRTAMRIVERPPIKPKVLCTSCRNIIGASVANEPHAALTPRVAGGFRQDDAEHYGCRICDTRLAREKGNHDFGVRWRLI